jgi:hypothetical protein
MPSPPASAVLTSSLCSVDTCRMFPVTDCEWTPIFLMSSSQVVSMMAEPNCDSPANIDGRSTLHSILLSTLSPPRHTYHHPRVSFAFIRMYSIHLSYLRFLQCVDARVLPPSLLPARICSSLRECVSVCMCLFPCVPAGKMYRVDRPEFIRKVHGNVRESLGL